MKKPELLIFDLDGVLVDTAKYHYLAWKELGTQMGIDFTEEQNEAFKGVSRMACMDIMCQLANKEDMSMEQRVLVADEKNEQYLSLISKIDASELLKGVVDTFERLKREGIKIALGSASKNAVIILEKTETISYFDAIIDGTKVSKAKPDPEVFTQAADVLGIPYENCVVVEDAFAGVQAAKSAGMKCIGIGNSTNLPNADVLLDYVGQITMELLENL